MAHSYKTGDRVRIAPNVEVAAISARYDADGPGWHSDMSGALGQTGTVSKGFIDYSNDEYYDYVYVVSDGGGGPFGGAYWRAADLVRLEEELFVRAT